MDLFRLKKSLMEPKFMALCLGNRCLFCWRKTANGGVRANGN